MSKTPEEKQGCEASRMAEEWIETNGWNTEPFRDEYTIEFQKQGYVAGYQAGRSNSEAVQTAAPQWISVKDRLPERNLNVLAWIKCGTSEYVFIETASGDPNMCSGWKHYNKDQVTHWMPLPAAPKEEV